ncbi:MAG: MBL fold metallo-hydrolase, partial [Elusimicrobia bacterium]|nr:MBL fold metallo-hydrolase [Elusimicrobiota bacterium]
MNRLAVFLSVIIFGSSNLWAQLKVYFVDVGQGDAIYIEFPNGKNALIDGGPSGAKIQDFLKAKGVAKIDYVALTH